MSFFENHVEKKGLGRNLSSFLIYVRSLDYGGIPTGEGILKYAFLWTTQYIVLLCMNDRKC